MYPFARLRVAENLFMRLIPRKTHRGSTWFGKTGDVVQQPHVWAGVAGLLAVAGGPRGRQAAIRGSACYGVTAILTNLVIKPVVGRSRPPGSGEGRTGPVTSSFPSGHAATDLAFTLGVAQEIPVLFFPLALATSAAHWSLVRSRGHYPTDVFAGGCVGVAVALAAWTAFPPPVRTDDERGSRLGEGGDDGPARRAVVHPPRRRLRRTPRAIEALAAVVVDGRRSGIGIVAGEWFVGPDPGVGNALPMSVSGDALTATTASASALQAGVYTVGAWARDAAGNWSSTTSEYLVAYDSNGGLVTGAGAITSPVGAYAGASLATGRASFGFVSRYQKGAATPSGRTHLEFKTAGLDFSSDSYRWLVISGSRARDVGTGTVNGSGLYDFMLTAVDGDVSGGRSVDRLRIKITDRATSEVVYDNQPGADDGSSLPTASSAGSIIIHPS